MSRNGKRNVFSSLLIPTIRQIREIFFPTTVTHRDTFPTITAIRCIRILATSIIGITCHQNYQTHTCYRVLKNLGDHGIPKSWGTPKINQHMCFVMCLYHFERKLNLYQKPPLTYFSCSLNIINGMCF